MRYSIQWFSEEEKQTYKREHSLSQPKNWAIMHGALEATNGEEAVDIAKGQRPDLILMDLMMPKMDGYTACSTIKTDQATEC